MNPLESWTEEQRSAFLYRACAEAETGTVRAELFRRLAGEAEAQAAIWRAQLTARGHPAPGPFVPDTRTKLVARMVRWVGPRRLRNPRVSSVITGASRPAQVTENMKALSVVPKLTAEVIARIDAIATA